MIEFDKRDSCQMRIEQLPTGSLTSDLRDAVIALKGQHWPYPHQSQISWFADNVLPSDVHLLGWADGSLLGYLRIVRAAGAQGDRGMRLALLDTVCIDRTRLRSGLGKLLIASANRAIGEENAIGVLACTESLAEFYRRCEWTLFSQNILVDDEKLKKLIPAASCSLIYDPHSRVRAMPLRIGVCWE